MGGDELIEFEERNYDNLIEKFIEKYRDKWETFVYEEYMDSFGD